MSMPVIKCRATLQADKTESKSMANAQIKATSSLATTYTGCGHERAPFG